MINKTYGTKSVGLGATFSDQVLTITGLTVGKSVMITYYINNPTSASNAPELVSSTGITRVDGGWVRIDPERIAIGARVCITTDTVATFTFRDVSTSPDYQFTAYQV